VLPSPPRSLVVGLLLAIALMAPGVPALAQKPTEAHWAFRAPPRPELPEVKDSSWVRNPVDRFVLAGLESVEFRHSPEADRVALIRRVTFDLTGLPPSPEDVDRFLADIRPDAYERVVDRLLESPQYGERQAQHWLDLAHHADSNGFELDAERPDAWRYRDWVVKAFNQDMPYDRFVTLQLAGDEAEPGDTEALIATGFGRGGPREVVGGNVDPKVRRQSELTEVTGTIGSVFLGLTIGCARCHDHKFDPLPTTDYYSLQAFFAGSQLVEVPIATKAEVDEFEQAKKAAEAKVAPLKSRKGEIEAPYRKALKEQKEAMLTPTERALMTIPKKDRTPTQKRLVEGLQSTLKVSWEEVAEAVAKDPGPHAERERLKREIEAIEQAIPRPPAHAQALIDPKAEAPETFVLRRGEVTNPGPEVEPRPPGILSTASTFDPQAIRPTDTTTGRRLALARWLTRPDNPLTTRVIVNRLWQAHFGRGIVATPSDFGVRGDPPTHPELLDWLATELVAQGWKLKPMHRLMVTSAAYRQLSTDRSEVAKKQAADDPEDNFLWRMNRRRLDAEGLRDAMLFASGELNLRAGGPGVLVPIEPEIESLIFTEAEVVDLWPETLDPLEQARRSLYLFRKRNVRYAMFDAFDAPDTQSACPKRVVSTHALQALVLLNSDFADGRAKALAGRLFREVNWGEAERHALAYKVVLGRDPRPAEIERDRAFLISQADMLSRQAQAGQPLARPTFIPERLAPYLAAAWVDFCRAMLNRNEFLYVP
jgi:Protein of unknown function (DUF1553)/Protein of unknown function (DUF1549)